MENDTLVKVAPNDIMAEQAVLGSMLVDKDAVIASIEVLKANDFYREDNKEIYAAMLELYNSGKNIDMITVKDQLTLRGTFEKVGGVEYLSSLIDMVPTTSNIENYVRIVEAKSTTRNMIKTANDILKMGYSGTEEVDTIIEQAEKKIFDVLQNRNSQSYTPIKEILIESFENLEKLYQNRGKVSGIETGFVDLDRKISGLNKGDLIIIAARPAMGKSAFVLNIASYVASRQNVPTLIFSLEMSKEQMVNRILASEGNVESMRIKNGNLESEDWQKLGEASTNLAEIPLYIDDKAGLTAAELRAKCRKAQLEDHIGLIIIDYLQLMEGTGKGASRQQDVADISRSLKILAKELKVPVIALSQLSRANEGRDDKKPVLSDIRESGAIEQDADIVMFIHRDEYYNPETTTKKGLAEIIIAKNRSGSTGTVELTWNGSYTKFGNYYKGEIEGE